MISIFIIQNVPIKFEGLKKKIHNKLEFTIQNVPIKRYVLEEN